MNYNQCTYEMKGDRSGGSPSIGCKKKEKEIIVEEELNIEIDYDKLVTEDDEPVDNLFSERQQHLFVDSIYASWKRKKPFLATSNVGIYERIPKTPIVPDALLSLDIIPPKNIFEKRHRCYMISILGKPPELVIEVVSNTVGGEKTIKKQKYAKMGVLYYVIYDPDEFIYKRKLHSFKLKGQSYEHMTSNNSSCWLEKIGLGLVIQNGIYDLFEADWLRWYDEKGNILKTGQELAALGEKHTALEKERANSEKKRANSEKKRANSEKKRANAEKKRAESEKKRADSEKKRADLAEQELERLKKLLADQMK
ncbi:protein containing DUF820 [Candidatus Magnetomorum sp. HK-1]|nr:protein containing DUF820 [Candidatus Magnetomorum sp. HK-1]